MLTRLNWLLFVLIYLFVNGQVFSVPVHLCESMAMSAVSTMPSSYTLKVHEHDQMMHQSSESPPVHLDHQMAGRSDEIPNQQLRKKSVNTKSKPHAHMKDCTCVDCDCTSHSLAQTNASISPSVELNSFIAVPQLVIAKSAFNFKSLILSNLQRPPIFS